MNFLKAEMERKKRQLAEKQLVGPDKKYFKRGDLMEKEREEYLQRNRPKEEDVKKLHESMQTKDKSKEKSTDENSLKEEDDDVPILPRIEVVRRLRERLQPIILFGETEIEACQRLRIIEVNTTERSNAGRSNDYQEAMEHVEKDLDHQAAQGSSKSQNKRPESDSYETSVTYEDLQEMTTKADKGDFEADCLIVLEFIRHMMTKWDEKLGKRDSDVKSSVMGKRETVIHAQTRTYLKPLAKMLKKQRLTDDVRDSLVKMIMYALRRDYILSHEAYMEMAVGNAPWPIGVTNAGIHARPARENIFSKNVAHVLNDETQRKYIQGLKRLITKAQEYYPTDPSRSVDFVKKD